MTGIEDWADEQIHVNNNYCHNIVWCLQLSSLVRFTCHNTRSSDDSSCVVKRYKTRSRWTSGQSFVRSYSNCWTSHAGTQNKNYMHVQHHSFDVRLSSTNTTESVNVFKSVIQVLSLPYTRSLSSFAKHQTHTLCALSRTIIITLLIMLYPAKHHVT